jgi:hypothetical protein
MAISKALDRAYKLKHKVKKKASAKVCDYCGKKFTGKSYSQISLNKCRACDQGYY